MNPLLSLLQLERSDERKNSGFNICANNQNVVNWSPTGHFVSGVTDGLAWVEGLHILCTNGQSISRSVKLKNQRTCLSFPATVQFVLIPPFSRSDGVESGDDQPSVAGTPDRAPRRNEEQRREFLQNDPRVLVAKEWEVQCRACQKWIKLGTQRKYDLTPWNQHCARCSGEL